MVHSIKARIDTLLRLRYRGHHRCQAQREHGQQNHGDQKLDQSEALLARLHRVTSPGCKGRWGRRVSYSQLRPSAVMVMRKVCNGTSLW